MARVCLVGFGRVGSLTAQLLVELGHTVVAYDSSSSRREEAESLGIEYHLASAINERLAARLASECDAIATALPSRAAEQALPLLLSKSPSVVVDVSYVRDPLSYRELAEERGVRLYVDAGVAPGLSNVLAARAAREAGRASEVTVYVGGISADPSAPLGLVASWSMADLLEEYTRKARARVNGSPAELDPIYDATRVEIPGLGAFDAMPTDGLRTLLESLRDVPTLVEYTLRYPGHVEIIRQLHELGLLSDHPYVVEGASMSPRALFSKILEEKLPRTGDRLVMYVEARGRRGSGSVEVGYLLDATQEGLGLSAPVLSYATALMHAWTVDRALRAGGEAGVYPPERFEPHAEELVEFYRRKGIQILKRVCETSH
ncbi:MAG: saccharopine dehydrogenase C-terminal domain-containing protein [Thermoproteota archaeon]